MSVDPMKLVVVKSLAKENRCVFMNTDDSGNAYLLHMDNIRFWITRNGNIRFINPDHIDIMDLMELDTFKSNGDPLDTAIYLIKKHKQITKEI